MNQIKINVEKISDFDLKLARNSRVIAAIDEILPLSLEERTAQFQALNERIANKNANLFEERVLSKLLQQRTAEWIHTLHKNLPDIEEELKKRRPPETPMTPPASGDEPLPAAKPRSTLLARHDTHSDLLDFLSTQKPPARQTATKARKTAPTPPPSFLRRHAKDLFIVAVCALSLLGAIAYVRHSERQTPKIETFKQQESQTHAESAAVKTAQQDIQDKYDAAAQALRFGDFEDGKRQLFALLAAYPTGQHAEDGYILLADSYRQRQRDPDKALIYYQQVLDKFPASAQAPITRLKMGFAYEDMDDVFRAKELYRLILKQYGETSRAGQLARERLKRLK